MSLSSFTDDLKKQVILRPLLRSTEFKASPLIPFLTPRLAVRRVYGSQWQHLTSSSTNCSAAFLPMILRFRVRKQSFVGAFLHLKYICMHFLISVMITTSKPKVAIATLYHYVLHYRSMRFRLYPVFQYLRKVLLEEGTLRLRRHLAAASVADVCHRSSHIFLQYL